MHQYIDSFGEQFHIQIFTLLFEVLHRHLIDLLHKINDFFGKTKGCVGDGFFLHGDDGQMNKFLLI